VGGTKISKEKMPWASIKKIYIETEELLSLRALADRVKVILNLDISYVSISKKASLQDWYSQRLNYWNDLKSDKAKDFPTEVKIQKYQAEVNRLDNLSSTITSAIEDAVNKIRELQGSKKGLVIDPSKIRDLVTALDGMNKAKIFLDQNSNPVKNPIGEKTIAKDYKQRAASIIEALTAARVEVPKDESLGSEDRGISLAVDGRTGRDAESDLSLGHGSGESSGDNT
jgi:hypothetical protein